MLLFVPFSLARSAEKGGVVFLLPAGCVDDLRPSFAARSARVFAQGERLSLASLSTRFKAVLIRSRSAPFLSVANVLAEVKTRLWSRMNSLID